MIKSILIEFVYILCITINSIHCYYGAENLITSFDQPVILNCTDLAPQRSIDIERVRYYLYIQSMSSNIILFIFNFIKMCCFEVNVSLQKKPLHQKPSLNVFFLMAIE